MLARLVLTGGLLAALPAAGPAGFVAFTDRAAWQAAAGTPTATEDFQGFTSDTSFRTAPVAFNGFSAVANGVTPAVFYNRVDVPPFGPLGGLNSPDGTAFFYGGTRFGGADGAQSIDLTFAGPTTAFGADFRGADGGEEIVIDVYAAGNVLLGTLNPTSNLTQFNGFALTGGERATRLVFRSTADGGVSADLFGMDNVALVAVPAPASAALLLMGLPVAGLLRRRRAGSPAR